MNRAAPLLPLCLALIACAGNPSAILVPPVSQALSRADGSWTWNVEGLSCASQGGLLSPTDGSEVFTMAQEGEVLRATFTDRGGNTVTFEGTVRRGIVEGTFAVRAPAQARAPLNHDRPIGEGKAYVVSATADTLYAFDLRLGAMLAVLPFAGGAPARPCADPDQRLLFVPLPGLDAVAVVGTDANRVEATLQGPGLNRPVACAASPDGGTLFVANEAGSLVRAELGSGTLDDPIPLNGTGTSDLCWGPEAGMLFAVHHTSSTLDVVDVAGGSLVTASVPTSPGPRSAALARRGDGSALLLVAGDEALDVFDPATLQRTSLPLPGFDVAITPDGATAYVSRTSGPDLATAVDLATLRTTKVFRGSAYRGMGIALCAGAVPLVALGDAYPAVILDPFDLSVFDNFAVGGEFIETVGSDGAAPRETVLALEGSAAGTTAQRRVAGTLRILRDTAAVGCVGTTLPWSATIR